MTKQIDYSIHLDLPNYGKIGLIEGTGVHFFNAMRNDKGQGNFLKHLVIELLFVGDKPITEEYLDKMPLKDVSYIITVISTMMDNKFIL